MGLGKEIGGEAAASVVLGRKSEGALCKLSGFRMLYNPSMDELSAAVATLLQSAEKSLVDIDFILTGINGYEKNDEAYLSETKTLFGNKALLKYKHLFGESFTASGIGLYVAAQCLKAGRVPASLFVKPSEISDKQPKCILLYNHSDGRNFSFTLLEA